MEFDVSADAQFVGVMAAYRDYRNAQWRTVLQAPRSTRGHGCCRTRASCCRFRSEGTALHQMSVPSDGGKVNVDL